MSIIRTTCPECGDAELTTSQVRVRICVDDGSKQYLFTCPVCQQAVNKPTDEQAAALLISAGVEVDEWTLPRELSEPRHGGAPISHDDLLAFHELLSDEATVAEVLSNLGS
jgi:endogenous inhibitor of DNA gyrase (YacG/DUF329 family)